MTLDYKEDYDFFEKVIDGISPQELSFDNILNFLYNNPDTIHINYFLEETWKINQEKIKHFKIK